MPASTTPAIQWDTGFTKTIDIGYPLDNAQAYPEPREGSEWVQTPSGVEDSWVVGIDEILEGSSRPTSPFTAKDGASMLDMLFERATHIPVWLLSLGNAVVSIDQLEEKMKCFGRETKAIEIKYQHLPAVATEEKKRENREFLVIGWDPKSPLLRDASTRSLEGAKK